MEQKKMAQIKMNGIILSENNLGDYDKMLTMLTPGVRQNIMHCKRCKETKQ